MLNKKLNKMKKILVLSIIAFMAVSVSFSAGYKVGDKAEDFKLQNIDGSYVSLSDYSDAKGFIVTFTCNGCPYAVAYQERIIELDKKYKTRGYGFFRIPFLFKDQTYYLFIAEIYFLIISRWPHK